MKLVIEIPNSLYANLSKIEYGTNASKRLLDCIKNGTPLPKGHGDLIDVNELIDSYELADFDGDAYDCLNEACRIANSMPTIIEADKGE